MLIEFLGVYMMNNIMFSFCRRLFIAASLASSFVAAEPVLVASLDFEDGVLPTSGRCGFGAQSGGQVTVSTDTTLNFNKSKGSLRGNYPVASGGIYVWGGCDVKDLNTEEVFVEFYAKMPEPVKQGAKFFKVFGQVGSGYANTTIQADFSGSAYGRGSLYQISFGDGSSGSNDTANVINLDGTNPSWVGRSQSVASIYTAKKAFTGAEWGDAWHHFRIQVKFNSGTSQATEKPDGAYFLEIDGTVYVDAKNIYNRHYSNLPIQKVSFFDWSQGGSVPFQLWYDNIIVSTGGFMPSLNPKPPKGI
jgi:hypothetical protein